MLRIAIVGCGKIADQHVHAIHRIADCRITCLCDQELLMARQLGERIAVCDCFSDLQEMLRAASPEVVHITTPPQSHFFLAEQCLRAGSHVYLEKPFTITAPEAESLIALAQRKGLLITAGHNYQFTLEMLQMRKLVEEGFLGGTPVHVESHWTYNLFDETYARALLGSRTHWVRQLPGGLLHNIISHGIAKLAEFLDNDLTEIIATAEQSAGLRNLGGGNIMDELRVLLRDKNGTTAFFCFSSQIKPGLNHLRIYGPANSVAVDHLTGTVIRSRTRSYKSYTAYFAPPFVYAAEHLRGAWLNMSNFLHRRLYQDFGMAELIGRFYHSIRTGGKPPIPYREIILTARIMDEIFAQIYSGKEAYCSTRIPALA